MSPLPSFPLLELPAVTAREMRAVDRLATDAFGISLAQIMELAGTRLAQVVGLWLEGLDGKAVTVLAGPGNNGGGGLVAARHIANRGAAVRVVLAQPVRRLAPLPRQHLATLLEMRVEACVAGWDLADDELERQLRDSNVIVDALLGYAAVGAPRGTVGGLVERIAAGGLPVIGLDLPSGIEPDTGDVVGRAVCAQATMIIALPKRGLLSEAGRRHSGALFLADIGLPRALYRRVGLDFPDPFSAGPIVRLD